MVIVDASAVGISAILAQREQDSPQYKVIAYASRSLTPVEKRYSQTDREGLALVWGIEHFRLFLLEAEFDVITDHKALEAIYNNPWSKPPARIERWMLRTWADTLMVTLNQTLIKAMKIALNIT